MLVVSVLTAVALASGCEFPATAEEIRATVERADSAWVEMDHAMFRAEVQSVGELVSCTSDSLESPDIAAVFRVQGMGAFLDRDRQRAADEMAASLAALPGFELPLTLVPAAHPLREIYETAAASELEMVPLATPEWGWIHVDGRRTADAPADRPYLLQVFSHYGQVLLTAVIAPGESPPPYQTWRTSRRRPDRPSIDAELDRYGRTRKLGKTISHSGFAASWLGVAMFVSSTFAWDIPNPEIPGLVVGFTGIGVMWGGLGLMDGAVARETAHLQTLGASVPNVSGRKSRTQMGLGIPLSILPPVGMGMYGMALSNNAKQAAINRDAMVGLVRGNVVRMRPWTYSPEPWLEATSSSVASDAAAWRWSTSYGTSSFGLSTP